MLFAVIKDHLVVNVIVAENAEIASDVTKLEVLDISDKPLRVGDYRTEDGVWHGSIDEFTYLGNQGKV